jgi:hypothetical protein
MPALEGIERSSHVVTQAAAAGETMVDKLAALGVRGILWQLARDGQIIDLRCEMPQCYCFWGRRYFEPRSTHSDWEPTADHYPRLKAHGGHLTPDNVRLAHRLCNRRDYTWRMKINAMLAKRMSLEEIAETLNATPRFRRFTARTDGHLHWCARHSFRRNTRTVDPSLPSSADPERAGRRGSPRPKKARKPAESGENE